MVVEDRTDLGHFLPGQFGTLDLGILRDDAIIISDLKFGAGVPVDAVQNRQLMIYALGFWFTYGHGRRPLARRVILNIDQPRAGGMKFWELDRSDLLAFGEEARAAALAVDDPDAPLVASEKGCRWCPVRQTEWGCATYDQLMGSLTASALLDLDDESPEMFPPERMTPERRYYTVRHAHLVTAWLAKLHEDSLRAAEAGQTGPRIEGRDRAEGRPEVQRSGRRRGDPGRRHRQRLRLHPQAHHPDPGREADEAGPQEKGASRGMGRPHRNWSRNRTENRFSCRWRTVGRR